MVCLCVNLHFLLFCEGYKTQNKFLLCFHVNRPVSVLNCEFLSKRFSCKTLYIIEKSYLLALKQSKENGGLCIMQERTHQAKMVTVILEQIGPGQNRCLAFSTFTFKQGQNTKSDKINHFHCILYTFTMNLNSMSYIQYILVMLYTHFY